MYTVSFFFYDSNNNAVTRMGNFYRVNEEGSAYLLHHDYLLIAKVPVQDMRFIVEYKDGEIVNMYNPNDI